MLERPRVAAVLLGLMMVFRAALQPGWAETDEDSHPSQDLTAQSGDPTAPLLQIQVTNFYSPDNRNGEGYSNEFDFQPVIPVGKSTRIPVPQIIRLTVPVLTTPGPGRRTGLGDIEVVDVFIPKRRSWGIWGAGFIAVAPTAAHDDLGAGKWQLGPAATVVFSKIPNWQIGGLLQNPISIAGDGDRESISELQFQPLINYLRGDWYFGAGDLDMTYDWKEREWTIPLAFQAGRVTQIGKYKYNLSVELAWTAVRPDDAVISKWGIKLGAVLLLPTGKN